MFSQVVAQRYQFYVILFTFEPQWLEHLWGHGKLFETWVVRVTEG